MLGPSAIEFRPLDIPELEFPCALVIGETFPQHHRKFCAIRGREFEELRKHLRLHAVILSRAAQPCK
jgi:hypothetical protein